MKKRARNTLVVLVIFPVLLLLLAVAIFAIKRMNTLEATVIANQVEAYEFTPDRSALVYATDTELQSYDTQTGETTFIQKIGETQESAYRELYIDTQGTIYVTEGMPDNDMKLNIIGKDSAIIPFESSTKTEYCKRLLTEAQEHIELASLAIITKKNGTRVVLNQYSCATEREESDFVTDTIELQRNPHFIIDGATFITSESTVRETHEDIVITSSKDRKELLDCSAFLGATCPVKNIITWAEKEYILPNQGSHIAKHFPFSRYMTSQSGQLIIKTDQELIMLHK